MAPIVKKVKEMPEELSFFMETPDIKGVMSACRYLVTHPTDPKGVAIQGRVVGANGVIHEPLIKLDLLDTDLCRKIAGRFSIASRKLSKTAIVQLLNAMKGRAGEMQDRADGLGDNTDDEIVVADTLGRRDILVNRFIGIALSPEYIERIKHTTQRKTAANMETGDGAKSERLYQEMAGIINDNDAVEHLSPLPLDGKGRTVAPFGALYCEYMENAGDEDASKPTTAKVTWQELPVIFKNLKKVYDTMYTDYFKSGHHEPDAMKYTDRARSVNGVKRSITALNAYYFFVQCWCDGDVMNAFTAFLATKFVGEAASSPKSFQASAKKQRTDELSAILLSNSVQTNVMDNRFKSNALLKVQERKVCRLEQDLAIQGDRRFQIVRDRSKMMRMKEKHRNSLFESNMEELSGEIGKYDITIAKIEDELRVAAAKLESMTESIQASDTTVPVTTFETPSVSRRSSIDSTPSIPLRIVGRPNTPIANSDDEDDDNEGNVDVETVASDDDNDLGRKQAAI
jgi:uncharacterized coiled-coil protein SlyX